MEEGRVKALLDQLRHSQTQQSVPSSVASLLSQLSAAPPTPAQDLQSCSFQQALPHLARLAQDSHFVAAISAMKIHQTDLERRLFDERRGIQKAQQDRVKKAVTKASITGAGTLTHYEANSMADAFRRELVKFDTERALPAWDALISKQQTELESLGVPAMYLTSFTADRERQQRVVQVLAGMTSE
ncbi:hypothetical protein EUX98_g471 [Antrodiella citrinella]|uniref:Uncharacterized protein n=1 Tax=Antrodiella citrinella TaxID=2447956 RepID=A0A4S4NCK7_9APHY|nr:hypothetical protein EUX98_g471 [Antrodiella citrinella]